VRFHDDAIWPLFDQLRTKNAVYYTPTSTYGSYWSVITFNEIMKMGIESLPLHINA